MGKKAAKKERLECGNDQRVQLKYGGVKLKYAWASFRGYYPEDLMKENQDCGLYGAQDVGVSDSLLFAVFDGHGGDGDDCSRFVRDNIKKELAGMIQKYPDDHAFATKRALMKINDALHADTTIEDDHSGTTSCSVFLHKGTILVANLGDSRAVIAQSTGKNLQAFPLSSDQSPLRRDERERIRKAGGRVLTYDQLEGIADIDEEDNYGAEAKGGTDDPDDDPPRVWLPDQDSPGCAFTRSIGDAEGETVGVFAEAEILNKTLDVSDRFIIIASDGVWEFLTNQEVVNMVAKFDEQDAKKGLIKAAKAIIEESYKLWLQYDVRTDDITIIIIKLEDLTQLEGAIAAEEAMLKKKVLEGSLTASAARRASKAPAVDARGAGSGASLRRPTAAGIKTGLNIVNSQDSRPVRRTLSKQKREVVQGASADDAKFSEQPEGGWGFTVEGTVSADQAELIKTAVATNFLFSHLNKEQLHQVCTAMEQCQVNANDVVVLQGQPGDWFYVVNTGTYDCTVHGESVLRYESTDGYVSFGELALMYGKPRAASITCLEAGVLWRLHRTTFREVVMRSPARDIVRAIRSVEVLKVLSVQEVQRLQDVMTEVTLEAGVPAIRQGEAGKEFYIIMEGTAAVTIKDGASEKEVMTLKTYDYFGERALLNDAPRAATVTGTTRLKLLYITKTVFDEVLGSLEGIIEKNRAARERQAEQSTLRLQAEKLSADATSIQNFNVAAQTGTATANLSDIYVGEYDSGRFTFLCVKKNAVSKEAKTRKKKQLSVMNMIDVWAKLGGRSGGQSPFVAQLLATFSDKSILYAVSGKVTVCDIATLTEGNQVSEEKAQFIVVGVAAALDALHKDEVVYRGCTPETVHIDEKGYPQLTDFYYSKSLSETGRTNTMVGQGHYMAPEMIQPPSEHGFACDFWALGVLTYELLVGKSPWVDTSRPVGEQELAGLDLYPVILAVDWNKSDAECFVQFPEDMNEAAKGFIKECMEPDESGRLGCGFSESIEELEEHEWFGEGRDANCFQFEKYMTTALTSPFARTCVDEMERIFSPKAERMEIKAPTNYGSDAWCADWDLTPTMGQCVEDSKNKLCNV